MMRVTWRRWMLSIAFILVNSCQNHFEAGRIGTNVSNLDSSTQEAVVNRASELARTDIGSYREFLASLARKGDFQALKAISSSNVMHSSFAAEELCKALSPEDAVSYCRSLRPGSAEWEVAFMALHHHAKPYVIAYVLEISKMPGPELRYFCYLLCYITKWPDLIADAITDLDNDFALSIPNQDVYFTVSSVAKLYVGTILSQLVVPYLLIE